MKVLFCGYRDWALSAYFVLWGSHEGVELDNAREPGELLAKTQSQRYDVVLLAGWSWKVPDEVLNNSYVIGVHPSDLPAFAGGSPLQNQILYGIKHTNASLFKVTPKMDGGPILGKLPFSLEGHIVDVFSELTRVTIELFNRFIAMWPNVVETPQPTGTSFVKRLKPEQSHLTLERMKEMTCSQLYDEIRCREDPYPNIYLEDETGRLYFKLVEFEPK